MEPLDGEGKRLEQLFESMEQIGFTDFLHGTDHLKLRDLINGIDMVDPFLFIPIALMHRIDTEKAGLPCRMWLAPLTDA